MGCKWSDCQNKRSTDNTGIALLKDAVNLTTLDTNRSLCVAESDNQEQDDDETIELPPKLIPNIMDLQSLIFKTVQNNYDLYPKYGGFTGLSTITNAMAIHKEKKKISQILKNVSLTIALYTNGANAAYLQNMHNSLYYNIRINHYDILPEIVQLIISFISGVTFHDEIEEELCKKQLEFSYSNSIVTFKYMNTDWLNIRSKHALVGDKICINCYVMSKGDEQWMGLVNTKTYHIRREIEKRVGSLLYYGGRQSSIQSLSSNSEWDNGYGGIHGFSQVIKCVESYQPGDWISFIINMDKENQNCKIYKNNQFVFEMNKLPFEHKADGFDAKSLREKQYLRDIGLLRQVLLMADNQSDDGDKKEEQISERKMETKCEDVIDDAMYFCVVVDDSNDAFLVEEVMVK